MTQSVNLKDSNIKLSYDTSRIQYLTNSGNLTTGLGNKKVTVLKPQRENMGVFVKLIRAISSISNAAITSLIKSMSKTFTYSILKKEAEKNNHNYDRDQDKVSIFVATKLKIDSN